MINVQAIYFYRTGFRCYYYWFHHGCGNDPVALSQMVEKVKKIVREGEDGKGSEEVA